MRRLVVLFSILFIVVCVTYVYAGSYTRGSRTTYATNFTVVRPEPTDGDPDVTMNTPTGVDSSNGYFYFRNNNIVTGGSRVDYYYRVHLTTSTWNTNNHWAEWLYGGTVLTEDDALAYDVSYNNLSRIQLFSAHADTFQLMIGVNLIHFYRSPTYAIPAPE